MKRIYSLLFFLGAFLLSPIGHAAGGPDAYGYTWTSSLDPGGPAYNWIDITSRAGVQTVTGLADDNSAPGMINVGFSFHYYWSDYSQLKVGSNGWLSFNNVSNIASCFPTIPAAGGPGDNLLAPLMSDLNFTGADNPGQVKYWTNNTDSCVISYIDVPFWDVSAPGWTGSNSFQVILCKADSSITFQYGALGGFVNNAACTDLTVGIENSTGAVGLQVHGDAIPPSSYAIRFEYPAVVLMSIQDPVASWNINAESKAVFIPAGLPYTLAGNYRNAGNTDVTTVSSVAANVTNAASANVYSASGNVATLTAGADTTYHFDPPWTPAATGQFVFSSQIANAQDINAGNNTLSAEIDVVDICAATMQLGYVSNNAPNGSLNWNGGANDDGAAVYFLPPVYPYDITQLQYFISSTVSDGFVAQVLDDDGPNGTPGTVLYTETVPVASVLTNAWNTVNLSSAVTMNDGGFYVVWIQQGTNIFLGTETAAPLSRQNFELLDGSWAEYRDNGVRDLLIRATIGNFSAVPVAAAGTATDHLSATFTDNSSGPGLSSWSWDFGDGNTSTDQHPAHIYSAAGTYAVCLIAENLCGSDTICQNITICDSAVAAYSASASFLNVSFTDASTGTDNRTWDFGDGNTSTQQNPVHAYSAPGTYTVCLISSNVCGYADTICQTITVCDSVVPGYTWQALELAAEFTDQSAGADSLSWDFGDGNGSTQQNPLYTYSAPGTYTVCLIASNACYTDTLCTAITVCQQPVAAYSAVTSFLDVSFTDESTGTIDTWEWDFGDGSSGNAPSPTHSYAVPGLYTACLVVSNACGNSDTICDQVFADISGIAETANLLAGAYPNPADNTVTVTFTSEVQDAAITLFDLNGRTVRTIKGISGEQAVLDISGLASGCYRLYVESENAAGSLVVMKR